MFSQLYLLSLFGLFKNKIKGDYMRRLFKFRYPKLTLLVVIVGIAYYIFSNQIVQEFFLRLNGFGYVGAFIGGLLFSFGFTTPFAIGILISLIIDNILLSGIIGGFGAMLADLVIFKLIKFSFMDEFKKLGKNSEMRRINLLIKNSFGHKIRIYLMYVFAGILIASPLPDETAVILLAGLTRIKIGQLAILSFVFNTIGILILLLI
jgi:vacuolar-type H+-ATPase subunit I/STV1